MFYGIRNGRDNPMIQYIYLNKGLLAQTGPWTWTVGSSLRGAFTRSAQELRSAEVIALLMPGSQPMTHSPSAERVKKNLLHVILTSAS